MQVDYQVRLVVFLLLLPAMTIAGPLSEIPSHGEIPRFLMMADGLYRGGQPTEQGFQLLKARGIKTVINLRMENDEAELVQGLGMNYVHIPVEDVRPWSQIPEAAIAKYFELVNNQANYPIFFHCQRGADRTGAMAALYRIALQGWDAKKAYSEARDIGMRAWYRGLKSQLYDFHPPVPAKLQPAIQPQ
jgi:tyrosine-protein phosphatase SIW14